MERIAKEKNWVVVNREPKKMNDDPDAHERFRLGSEEDTSFVGARWASRSANMATVRG